MAGDNNLKIVLDSNILISSILFDGTQRDITKIIAYHKIPTATSLRLIVEILEVLRKKFKYTNNKLMHVKKDIMSISEVVYPSVHIDVVRDKEDNKVIEVAVEGNCTHIVTGDKDLLVLKKYKDIEIISSSEFLDLISNQFH